MDTLARLKGRRVAVAMSGGVDSSVAAALLLRAGANVEGVTFRLFEAGDYKPGEAAIHDAARVAEALSIPHRVLDLRHAFQQHVVTEFIDSYRRGRTPNPCIVCNENIKFAGFLQVMESEGVFHIATGHHARLLPADPGWRLCKGVDPNKDQSYFLYRLAQHWMERVVFPIGHLQKGEVRTLAHEMGIPVADKVDSQEICFIKDGRYTDFLARFGGLEDRPGAIVLANGERLGSHRGLHHHTIGQRKGLGIAWDRPLYVVEKRTDTNELVVGEKRELGRRIVDVSDVVWSGGKGPLPAGTTVTARIRYRAQETQAVLTSSSADRFELLFDSPVEGVAAGQSAVLYQEDQVVGGGWIDHAQA